MNAQALLDILRDVDAMDVAQDARDEFRQMIKMRVAPKMPEPEQRVLFARHLMDEREDVSTIARRLMERFEVGKSQAYRDIEKALDLRGRELSQKMGNGDGSMEPVKKSFRR